MSKVIFYVAMSADGYIADADGGVAWLDDFNDVDYGYDKFVDGIGALVMGAKTYEQILVFGDWPYKGKKSYVLTHRDLPVHPDGDIAFVDDAVASLVTKAKTSAGDKDVWLVGGSAVATSFLQANVIDEMMIFVIPKLLGDGVPLFGKVGCQMSLELMAEISFPKGIVLLHYGLPYESIEASRS